MYHFMFTECILEFVAWISFCFSPVKYNFIKAKYEMLAFVHQLPITDDVSITNLSKVCFVWHKCNYFAYVY